MNRAESLMIDALAAKSQEECPVCEAVTEIDGLCLNCKVDLDEVFVCSFRVDSEDERRCRKTSAICPIKGLGYESCSIYLGSFSH